MLKRKKPYVCVECDYHEHYRFQDLTDVDAGAGVWLRCLVYTRAQEQDGVVRKAWLQRTFEHHYDLHAYAPRNQTRAMLEESRELAKERAAAWRAKRQRRSKASRATDEGDGRVQRTNALVPTSTFTSTS